MQQMETQTARGARRLGLGIALFLFGSLLILVAGYYLLAAAPDVPSLVNQTSQEVNQQALSKILPLLPTVCGMGIILFVAIIEVLLGFLSFYRGKDEYGEEHRKNIERVTILLVLVVVVVFLGIGTSLASGVGGAAGALSTMSIASAVVDVFRALLIGFLLIYLIKALVPAESANKAYVAMCLYVASPIASYLAAIAYSPPDAYFEPSSGIRFDPMWMIPSVVGTLLTVLALVIYFLVYRQVHRRLRSHELPPIWEQPGQRPGFQMPQEQRWQPPPGA